MREVNLRVDNGPVRKIPFIAIYSLESRTTIELLLIRGACRILGHLLRFLGCDLPGEMQENTM